MINKIEKTTEIRPKRCFCKVPPSELIKWAREKFIHGRSTLELMEMVQSAHDREMVSLIAMFDVDKGELDRMLGHETKPGCNLEHCRNAIRDLLRMIVDDKESCKQ